MGRLQDKTAMITGGGGGIGGATCARFAQKGARVAGRIGKADDLPGAIVFFASDDAAFVTGQVLSVSGGLTMAG